MARSRASVLAARRARTSGRHSGNRRDSPARAQAQSPASSAARRPGEHACRSPAQKWGNTGDGSGDGSCDSIAMSPLLARTKGKVRGGNPRSGGLSSRKWWSCAVCVRRVLPPGVELPGPSGPSPIALQCCRPLRSLRQSAALVTLWAEDSAASLLWGGEE